MQTKVRGCVEEGGNTKAQQASADDEFGPQPAGLTEEATEEKEEPRDEDMSDKERIRETEQLLGEKAEEWPETSPKSWPDRHKRSARP